MGKTISLVDEANVHHYSVPDVCATNTTSTTESIVWFGGHPRYARVSRHRDQSGTMAEARRVRREWLSLMGYSEEEIVEALKADVPPLDLIAERVRFEAAKRLRDAPPSYEEFRDLLGQKSGHRGA